MKVGLYYNANFLSENLAYIELVTSKLRGNGITCVSVKGADDLDGLDVLMVFGGDGTILTMATECAKRGVKIIGINYGHTGFLAEFERDKVEYAADLLCGGSFETVWRQLLKVESDGKVYYALNDLVVQRSTSGNAFSNTIGLKAEIDGTEVDNFIGDGLIVSTPTGSTAYSLAAGGSVMTPDIEAFSLTPICAHSLHSRPIIYSDKSTLVITSDDKKGNLNVIIDGKAVETVSKSRKIKVVKADFAVGFVTDGKTDFFSKLKAKLNKWSK